MMSSIILFTAAAVFVTAQNNTQPGLPAGCLGSYPDIGECEANNWYISTPDPCYPLDGVPRPGQQVYIQDELNFCINLPDPDSIALQEDFYSQGKLPTILDGEGYVRAFCFGSYLTPDAKKIPVGGIQSANVIVSDDYLQVWGFMNCDILNINCTMDGPESFSDAGQYDTAPYQNCGKEPYSGTDPTKHPTMPYYVEQAGHGGTDQFGEDRPIYCMRICTGTDNCPVTEDTAGCRTTMGIDFTQAYGFTYQDNRNGVTGPVITSNYTVPTTTTAVATTVGTKTSVASQSTTVASTTSSGALGMSVVVVQFFIFPALFII